MFLVHFRGEWHSGIPYYTQNRKVSGWNTTNALGQTLRPNLLIRLLVDFGSHLKVLWLTLNEWGFLLVNGPKLTLLLIKKSLKKLHVLFFFFFLLPFSRRKQISTVVLAAFQGQYLRTITITLIWQLQWTDAKATLENVINSFLENSKLQ